jgi:ABC-2 type transport system permease protein
MATNTPDKNQRQRQAAIRLVLMAAILICVNILASYFHTGLDLTQEKRFSLTAPTKKLLRNMNEVAVIDVYLKGKKFPAELQRMQQAVRERLASFKDIAGNKVIYRFIDPLEGKNDKEQKAVVHGPGGKGHTRAGAIDPG